MNVSFISLLTRSNLRTNSNGYLFSFGLLISFYGNSMPQSMLKRHNSYMPQQHSRRFSSISAPASVHSRTFCNFPPLCCGGLHFQKSGVFPLILPCSFAFSLFTRCDFLPLLYAKASASPCRNLLFLSCVDRATRSTSGACWGFLPPLWQMSLSFPCPCTGF